MWGHGWQRYHQFPSQVLLALLEKLIIFRHLNDWKLKVNVEISSTMLTVQNLGLHHESHLISQHNLQNTRECFFINNNSLLFTFFLDI